MITCWLCRESFEPGHIGFFGLTCPSCQIEIQPDGSASADPGTMHINIALARALDRLANAIEKDKK